MKAFVALALLALPALSNAEVASTCFSRTYSAEHMRKHAGQTLQSLKLIISQDIVMIDGVAAADGKTYSFAASEKIAGADVTCAEFTADGDQDEGCVNIQKRGRDQIAVSPVAMTYKSWDFDFVSKGIALIRCAGNSSDGEGCEAGKLRTVLLKPSNPEDAVYLLNRVSCN